MPLLNEKVLYHENQFVLHPNMRTWMDMHSFLSLGELPPYVDGIRAYPSEDSSEILLEVSIKHFGDQVAGAHVKLFSNPLNQVRHSRRALSRAQLSTEARRCLHPILVP